MQHSAYCQGGWVWEHYNANVLHSCNSRSDPACRPDNWSCDHLIIHNPSQHLATTNKTSTRTYLSLARIELTDKRYWNLTKSVTNVSLPRSHGSLDFIGIRTCRHDQEVAIVKHGSVENCKLSVRQSSVVHWGEPTRWAHWRIKCWDLPTDVELTGGRVDGVKYLAELVLVVY